MRIRVLGALLLALAACTPAPEAPRPVAAAAAQPSSTAQESPLRLVVVHWKVKPGHEKEFLDYWSERATVADRSGLVAEFLSSVEDRDRFPWINWRALDPRWTSFFNIGIWRDAAAFQEQIGRFIDGSRPPLPFEAERRERVFVTPERWRIGASPLPAADPPGVR